MHRPCCASDAPDAQGVSVLAHALEDDGGLGVDHAVAWVEEGKRLTQAALADAPETRVWARESYVIEFTDEYGIAFGMDDPACAEKSANPAVAVTVAALARPP
ncbi:hypothetical protein ASB57_15645 [Bordetella sp. N]|nr:hypothetical protein ASB57_15645 [Bordetella sp. N]